MTIQDCVESINEATNSYEDGLIPIGDMIARVDTANQNLVAIVVARPKSKA